MSNDHQKFKKSLRRFNDENAVKKQLKIAKQHGMNLNDAVVKEPHRLSKHHAMDCGNPHCYLCGNPRKTHKIKLTNQERKLFQDLDNIRDKHSNGSIPEVE